MSKDSTIERLLALLETQTSLLETQTSILVSNQKIIGEIISLAGSEDLTDSNSSQWISTKEAAILVGVTSQTMRDWVRTGEVKGKRVGERKFSVYKPSALARAKFITD